MESRFAEYIADNGSHLAENAPMHSPFLSRGLFLDIIPLQLLLNILIFVVLILLLYWLLRGPKKSVETPLDLLKKRYVNGEIDKETYLHMKKIISD